MQSLAAKTPAHMDGRSYVNDRRSFLVTTILKAGYSTISTALSKALGFKPDTELVDFLI